jgi:class 3 adenylate cyclase/tetratricopeptide (TPR) repeat protein
MPGIREWLNSHGLSDYADRFVENRIDLSVLPDLTDDDLKELGVFLGDRRRILRLITELAPKPPVLTAPVGRPQEGERRQVTVMFADLVGSTALATGMDPEDLREVFAAYSRCAEEIVTKFGGTVAQYMGDGVVAYFGYPHAHEDDADRAVRAGLELVAAVAGLRTRIPQQLRIGIATGVVVIGNLTPSIVGETPNLAARLQTIAKPNMVVISEGTRRLLGHLFELEDLGTTDLKGIVAPVQVWAVLRPTSSTSRFEALHPSGTMALVGREDEYELLRRRWLKAKGGEGQTVLLSGEAGIGKSHLTVAFSERLKGERFLRIRCFCSPQHTNSALYPLIDHVERSAGFAREDSLQTKLNKLDALLRQSWSSAEDSALFVEMLSLPNDGRYPVADLAPRLRRQRTMDALVQQVEILSGLGPVLVIFEDAHWADPTSLELIGRLTSQIVGHRVLMVISFRPEFEAPWIEQAHVTALALSRLAPGDVDVMIDHIIGNNPLPAAVRQDIIERTDGIPLFVEEMTKAVLETGSEDEATRTAALVPSSAMAVPASLHASLMARLDRLGGAKELAQVGAVIGREFSHELLAAVASRPEAKLQMQLDKLIRSGLLFRQGAPPDATYLFKHALVQDAAYGLLLREPRRRLHARVAETFESRFTEVAESKPEVLARHWAEAGDIEKAATLWGKAGRRSAERSALVEATEQLRRALDMIATLASTPALRREEIKLHVELITPLLHVRGYAAPETRAAVERARLLIEQSQDLGEPPEDPLLLFSVLYGLWVANLVAFNGDVALELAVQFLALAKTQNASAPLMNAHRQMGLSLLHTANITDGRSNLDQAIALYELAPHQHLVTRFGQHVGAASLCWRSIACWLLGYPDTARTDAERALAIAREERHLATSIYVLNFSLWSHLHFGDYSTAGLLADEYVPLQNQLGSSFWTGWGMMQRGCLMTLTGKAPEAAQTISAGVELMRSTQTTMWMPLFLSHLALAQAELGQLDDATAKIGEAMTAVKTTKEDWYEAEINRLAGEIALLGANPDAASAKTSFGRALEIARTQKAKSWELRAAMSMARLLRTQGSSRLALDVLAPIYGWYTQGFDTLDLRQAKTLLDDLSKDLADHRVSATGIS